MFAWRFTFLSPHLAHMSRRVLVPPFRAKEVGHLHAKCAQLGAHPGPPSPPAFFSSHPRCKPFQIPLSHLRAHTWRPLPPPKLYIRAFMSTSTTLLGHPMLDMFIAALMLVQPGPVPGPAWPCLPACGLPCLALPASLPPHAHTEFRNAVAHAIFYPTLPPPFCFRSPYSLSALSPLI